MKQENQVFFKTVRPDGSSVWAPKGLSQIYEIGKTYKFPYELPAHVFVLPDMAIADVWDFRAEAGGGNRVLICYGNLETRRVPCLSVSYYAIWNFKKDVYKYVTRECSTEFTVIGEIFPPVVYEIVEKDPIKIIDFSSIEDLAKDVAKWNIPQGNHCLY